MPNFTIHTVGHSNHAFDHFLGLLRAHRIDVVADVRSRPVSSYCPYFSRENISTILAENGFKYVFMGRELGGQPPAAEFYDEDGRALYWRMAESEFFLDGVTRLYRGMKQFSIATMCSEENPSACHRRLLLSRVLHEQGVDVRHIRGDGRLELEEELARLDEARRPQLDIFAEVNLPQEREQWKSIQSGLRKKALGNSSESYVEQI